jgi:hypothetical protein
MGLDVTTDVAEGRSGGRATATRSEAELMLLMCNAGHQR